MAVMGSAKVSEVRRGRAGQIHHAVSSREDGLLSEVDVDSKRLHLQVECAIYVY